MRARPKNRAERCLVGGVNSPVRAFRAIGGDPVWLARGQGAFVTDVRGRRLADFIMGWGSLILGHNPPEVVRAIRKGLASSTILGLTSQPEIDLAEAIAQAMPSIEQVRFTASGTEACMTAIRLARAATGRDLLLTFEGCYHGHSDGLLVKRGSGLATLGLASSGGVPEPIARETLVVPYQDMAAVRDAFDRYGSRIAAVLLEPVAANMGVIAPDPAFLIRLREVTAHYGSLLVFDEVVTGFRLAYGGAQGLFNVIPDLTVLGKIIGGGLPVGAVGGPRRLMRLLAPEGPVYHAGTFAGHPLGMAAGAAALRTLKRRPPYARLDASGARLAAGLQGAAARAKMPVRINRQGSMLTVFFSGEPVNNFQDVKSTAAPTFAAWARRLLEQGVLLPPSPFEAMFLSTAHTDAMLDRMVESTERIWMEARG